MFLIVFYSMLKGHLKEVYKCILIDPHFLMHIVIVIGSDSHLIINLPLDIVPLLEAIQ